jgi:hypothetical protein
MHNIKLAKDMLRVAWTSLELYCYGKIDVHLELGRPWKIIAFHMFYMDRRVCTAFI